jgi:hypothetical protein
MEKFEIVREVASLSADVEDGGFGLGMFISELLLAGIV